MTLTVALLILLTAALFAGLFYLISVFEYPGVEREMEVTNDMVTIFYIPLVIFLLIVVVVRVFKQRSDFITISDDGVTTKCAFPLWEKPEKTERQIQFFPWNEIERIGYTVSGEKKEPVFLVIHTIDDLYFGIPLKFFRWKRIKERILLFEDCGSFGDHDMFVESIA